MIKRPFSNVTSKTVIALIAQSKSEVAIQRIKRKQVYEVIQKAHRLFKVIESSD